MMLRMRESPTVIWHQQYRVHDQTHGVVGPFGLAQRAMPTLVRNFPEPGENEPLAESVDGPCKDAQRMGWEKNDLRCESHENGCEGEVS